jgi:hypothetical protein
MKRLLRRPTPRAIPQEARDAMKLKSQAMALRRRAADLRRSADADDGLMAARCDADAAEAEGRAAALLRIVADREAEARAWRTGTPVPVHR